MASINIQYPVTLYAQPTSMTCWSAAATMLLGTNQSIGPGSASTHSNGGLLPQPGNVASFARSHGFQLYYPQSWTIEGLIGLIESGPFAILGALPSLHAVVVGGMQGDGTTYGTTLTIYDPWPPNVGSVYRRGYGSMIQKFPLATIYIIQ